MFIKFNLKNYNTSGISYKDDGQIPIRKIENGKIINTTSINFKKPYKLQIRANKMINGKRTNLKRTFEFPPDKTLLEAVKECAQHYIKMMNRTSLDKFKRNEIKEDTPFGIVWENYLNYKVEQYKGRSDKTEYDKSKADGFYNNHLKKYLENKAVNEITHEDLIRIISKMKNIQTGKPLSERTKRKVYQYVNPVYTYLKIKRVYIESPASQHGLPPLQNERKIDLSIENIKEIFLKLKNYEVEPFNHLFLWLMHGRRQNEVFTLQWTDINFSKDIYTIRAEHNKPRVDMSYILTPRLKETLEKIGIKEKGYIFPSLTDPRKVMNDGTLRNHWDKLDLPIGKHQIRNCIQVYLKNAHAVPRDIVDSIIGHKQNKNVGDRYGNYKEKILSDKLNLMLDEIFNDKYSKKINENEDKLKKLKEIFPEKTNYDLRKILEIL